MKHRWKLIVVSSVAMISLLSWSDAAMAADSQDRGQGRGDHYSANDNKKKNGSDRRMNGKMERNRDHQPNKKGNDRKEKSIEKKSIGQNVQKPIGQKPIKENVQKPTEQKPIEEKLIPNVSIVADLDPAAATGIRSEGLTGDRKGRLYTSDMDSRILYRVTPKTGEVEKLTVLPRSASGMAFDRAGNLYLASGGSANQQGVILQIPAEALKASTIPSEQVRVYATGVNGANGLVFDREGVLYVSGGATGNIYRVLPDGTVKTWASGITAERPEQQIVVNGLAFDKKGYLYMANTSSGEINRVKVNNDGSFGQVEQFAKDSKLYGADGIVFGRNGVLYVAVNERNAIVQVTKNGVVTDVTTNNNLGPLEFPASLHFAGNKLYASNFDIERGANSPNSPGIGASIAKITLTKGRLDKHVIY